MKNLSGKVAVITGGGSGIGRALAHAFAAQGMKVVLADVDEIAMRAVEAELAEGGTEVLPVVCDTSLEPNVYALAQATLDRFGGAHVLCNNAGVAGRGDPWTGPMSSWEWVVGINLYGVIHGIRAFLPIMQDQGEGHIVNTASMAGLLAVPGVAAYNATKTAVVAITEGLFLEMKGTGSPVGVSVLCPGFVKTNLVNSQKWQPRLGAEPPMTTSTIGQIVEQMLTDGVENGVDPAGIAAEVVDAILTDRFWILTHPEMRQAPVERMQRAAAQENPA
ncbi:MAG TPA: SDR family NAD(P)-dependent oxidoreductase [Ilumatobacteraceae bacterium]|nr:SDR family NAD(P)-dependent oxidoreductase [Ilumatobacteraceae bacterium]HRB03810.1 SDR family NAD(P)-dependent oxidoreductase [Ilumatobacteraceae bacterium]